jgi:hypothetical protein
MWLIAEYRPSTFFSLRPANATTSGGKTLVTPTPFALKMALLDAAIRVYGIAQGETWFPQLRDLAVAARLPEHLTVVNTFIKIMRPHKGGPKDTFGTGVVGPMGNTIAYREFVQYGGALRLALEAKDNLPLLKLLAQVNYLGKRGGFMQFARWEEQEALPDSFTRLNPAPGAPFRADGLLQVLDDCGPKMTFAHADIYSGKGISLDKPNGRVLQPVVLPYRQVQSSRGFTLYGRITG